MWIRNFHARLLCPPNSNANNRRSGRFHCELLGSSLGPVLDLSSTGARVRCAHPWGVSDQELLSIKLLGPDNGLLTLQARVVWIKKVGWLAREVGLQFESLTPSLQAAIQELARTFSTRRVMMSSGDDRKVA